VLRLKSAESEGEHWCGFLNIFASRGFGLSASSCSTELLRITCSIMDQTVAYEGLEIQEIGRSSAFKGKDKCQENPSKEPDSSSTEPWCAPADRFQEHHRDSSKNRQEFCHKNFPKYVRRIEQLDGSALLHYVIVTDAATALKNQQEFMENCIRYNIRFILWLDAENAFKRVMATDGGTALKSPQAFLANCSRHNIWNVLCPDAQDPFELTMGVDRGTALKSQQKALDLCFGETIPGIVGQDAQDPYGGVMATDGGTALKNEQKALDLCFGETIPGIVGQDAQDPYGGVMATDGGTVRAGSPTIGFFVAIPALKNRQEVFYICAGGTIPGIVGQDAQDPYGGVMATDRGTGMDVNQQ
jgi:hypothetical protein